MMISRLALSILLGFAFACGGSPKTPSGPAPGGGDRVLVHVDDRGVGLAGHDPISYWSETGPVAGAEATASQHGGATYHFASAEAKAKFDGDAARYTPQYGGYCAYAASQGRLSPSDPKVFQVTADGQLLMFTNAEFKELFNKDPVAHKQKADENWPGLVGKHGK